MTSPAEDQGYEDDEAYELALWDAAERDYERLVDQ